MSINCSPVRGVGDEAHQAASDQTSGGDSDEPSHVNPGNHSPVNGPPVTIAETNSDNGTSDALSGRNGKLCKTKLAMGYLREIKES